MRWGEAQGVEIRQVSARWPRDGGRGRSALTFAFYRRGESGPLFLLDGDRFWR